MLATALGMVGLGTEHQPQRSSGVAMANILIVDDNEGLVFGLTINMQAEGYTVYTALNGAEAISLADKEDVHLVILDLVLPDMSGFDVLRAIQQRRADIPVIVVSARTEEIDKVTAFRLGAHDYVVKPFGVLELIERVKVRLNRQTGHVCTSLSVDVGRRTVAWKGRQLLLTRLEFDLLLVLVQAGGRVLSKQQLLATVWRVPEHLNTRTVDYHLSSLKRKLAAAGVPSGVRTVHRKGVSWTSPGMVSLTHD
jgi:DNA-binding response OmpR family regulator